MIQTCSFVTSTQWQKRGHICYHTVRKSRNSIRPVNAWQIYSKNSKHDILFTFKLCILNTMWILLMWCKFLIERYYAYMNKYKMYLLLQMNLTERVMCRPSEVGFWGQTGASDTSYSCKYLSGWGFHLLRSNKTGLTMEQGFG